MHSHTKGQREAVSNLVQTVLRRDMGTFNPDRFRTWIKETDQRFGKVGLSLTFRISMRTVNFIIKEIRTKRVAFQFAASTRVPFDDGDVIMSLE